MKVLLVNPNHTAQNLIPLGLAYLSACLKEKGHETSLFDTTFSVRGNKEKSFKKRLKEFKPNVVAITCREVDFEDALSLAKIAKKNGKMVVWGGTYPTVVPEEVMGFDGVDIVCIGEGEESFVELLEKVRSGKSYLKTKSFWFKKKDGSIVRNLVRNLNEDIGSLPAPDWDVFLKESNKYEIRFISSRGCPFNCTYCVNHIYQKIYGGKGKYVRLRTCDKLIEEIKNAVKKYDLKEVVFLDDAFTVDKKRLREFAKKYRKEIDLPFWIITRADMVDYDTFKLLKEAGLVSVSMGVESGNDFIRKKVLRRHMSRETIVNAFEVARKLGIFTHSYNIVGAPYETEETIWETINLNREIKPNGVQVSVLTPYKGTEIRETVEKNGLLLKGDAGDFYTESTIKNENLSVAEIEAWQKTVWLYATAPKFTYPAIHAARKTLQYSPAGLRRWVGQGFILSAMVFGLYKRGGFFSTAKIVSKRLIGI